MQNERAKWNGWLTLNVGRILSMVALGSISPGQASGMERLNCATIFASAGSIRSAPGAIASAWAELLTKERTLTSQEAAWISTILLTESASVDGAFHPPGGLFDGAVQDALASLEIMFRQVVEEAGVPSSDVLSELKRISWQIVDAHGEARGHADRQKNRRTEVVPTVMSVSMGRTFAKPLLLSDGRLVVGSEDGHLYFLSQEGEVLDRVPVGAPITSSAIQTRNGNIVVGDAQGGVLFFRDTGKWMHRISVDGRFYSNSPIQLSNGAIVVGSTAGKLVYLSESGEIIASYSAPPGNWIYTSPLELSNGDVLIATAGPVSERMGWLILLSAQGRELSKRRTDGPNHSTPIQLKNGTIVVGGGDKKVHFLTSDLREFSTFEMGDSLISKPLELSNGNVVVPSLDFHLYYLNRLGELVAKVRTGVQSYDGSPAEFSNGTVVVPFERGTILFLSDTGDVVGRWEDPSGVPFRSTPVELSDGRVSICSSSMGVYFLNSESVIGKRAAP